MVQLLSNNLHEPAGEHPNRLIADCRDVGKHQVRGRMTFRLCAHIPGMLSLAADPGGISFYATRVPAVRFRDASGNHGVWRGGIVRHTRYSWDSSIMPQIQVRHSSKPIGRLIVCVTVHNQCFQYDDLMGNYQIYSPPHRAAPSSQLGSLACTTSLVF